MFFEDGTPHCVELKSYTTVCGGTIPRACFGDIHHMFSFNFRLRWGQVKIEGKLYDRSTTPECSEDRVMPSGITFGFTYPA